ncbi:MAG: hypothetical protein ACI3XR_09825 [Eubacteriales bacterium]
MDNNQFENNVPNGTENEMPPVQKKPNLLSYLKKPLVLIPVIGVAAALLCIGAVSANSGKAVTNSAMNDLGDLVKDTDLVTALMKSCDSKGRVTLTVEEGDLLPTDARIDLWMNRTDSKYVLKAEALGEDVTLYLSDTDLIGQTGILSDTYGLNFETLVEDLESAEWFRNFRTELEYRGDFEQLEQQLEFVSDQISEMKQAGKDGEKLINKYYNLLFETVYDNAKVTTTGESGNRVITIVVDPDCLAKSVDEVWKKAAKDKKLTGYLDDYMSVELLEIPDYDDWADILLDEDLREDACSAIERFDFEIEIEVTASSVLHNLKKLKVTLEVEGEKNVASVTLDRTEKNVTKFKVAVQGETYLSAKLTEDGDDLSGSLSVRDEEVFSFKWDYEKKDKSYKLTVDLPSNDLHIILKGDYEASSKQFYLKVGTVRVDKSDTTVMEMKLNVALEIVAGEKTPEFPAKYENIFDLTEDDLNKIKEELRTFVDEFKKSEEYQKLSDLFGNFGSDPVADDRYYIHCGTMIDLF